MKVSVIIPALNEEAAIGCVVAEIPRALVSEIVVVDNGSTDATAKVAGEAGARVARATERGYGAACMAGVAAEADADIYVFLDGDGSDVASELPRLLAPVLSGQAMLALGVRAGRVEAGSMPLHQRIGNRLLVGWLALLSGRSVRDLPSFKVMTAEALRSLDLQETTHGWTAELISKAALRRLQIAELETGYRRRLGESKVSGTVRGSLLAGWRIFSTITRCWAKERRLGMAAAGAAIGSLLGAAFLAFTSIGLLSIEGTNYKVLAAVWLWALPVLGIGAAVGYA
ncbi:MAG: glycosyltransferase family 2 protein, partial [Chloroflexota bacterium]